MSEREILIGSSPSTAARWSSKQFAAWSAKFVAEHSAHAVVLRAIATFPDRLWRWRKRADLMQLVVDHARASTALGLPPLALVEDRTPAQRREDGDA